MKKIFLVMVCALGLVTISVAQEKSKSATKQSDVEPAKYTTEEGVKEEKPVAYEVSISNEENAANSDAALALTEKEANQVAEIEKSVAEKQKTIANDTKMNEADKKSKLADVEALTGKKLKQILGEAKYTHYMKQKAAIKAQ